MKIGLFTSVYFNNIGNGFIDLGCEAQLEIAMPKNADLLKLSQCANFAASVGNLFLFKEYTIINWLWTRIMQRYANRFHDQSYSTVNTLDVFSPVKIALLDYLILPGCILTVPFFKIFGKLLEDKVKQGCKLIFWAASGNHYTPNEIKVVSSWLEKLKPYAICTRDSKAYGYYKNYSENAFNGIDNVFFVNRLDIPVCKTIMDPYVILNFDEPKHVKSKKELASKNDSDHIIYTDHKPYPYSKIMKSVHKDVMCSDYPLDYLFLYKNVKVTYSDRVHACIPTLSFGNRAQLFSDSPRIALFENVGIDLEQMKKGPIDLDLQKLQILQDKQINFLSSILK